MGILSKLLTPKRLGMYQNPHIITAPILGMLNLDGSRGDTLLQEDIYTISSLFVDHVISADHTPQCQVLFVYCRFNTDGKIIGTDKYLSEYIFEARASVVVVATENKTELGVVMAGSNPPSNIILVRRRKEKAFSIFIHKIFEKMFEDETMLMAFNKLAPQIPVKLQDPAIIANMPETVMLAGAGHIVFKD